MRKHREQIIWLLALLFLFFMNPATETTSLCVFKLVGFRSCFGCGIGHAIHYALHLQLQQSWQEHVAGVPAAAGMLY